MTSDYYWTPEPVNISVILAQLTFLGDIPTHELQEIFADSAEQLTIPMRGLLYELWEEFCIKPVQHLV